MNDLLKGLKLPVLALPGVGQMPAAEEDEKEAARATQILAIKTECDGNFSRRIHK